VSASGVQYDQDTEMITYTKQVCSKTNWCASPELVALIHNTVVKHKYKFSKAVKELRETHGSLFSALSRATVYYWYARDRNSKLNPWKLKKDFLPIIEKGNSFTRENNGVKGVLDGYTALEQELKDCILSQRKAGIPVDSRIAQALMIGIMMANKFPAYCGNKLGGNFQCSRRWVRDFIQKKLHYSYRRSTNAAQHLPDNYKKQIKFMIDRIALLVDEHKIPADLIINCDQTGVHYMPKSNYTYELKNSNDVSVLGYDTKKQITAMTGCTASNIVLPLQLIYEGKEGLEGAFPSEIIVRQLRKAGFDLRQTESHWSSFETTVHYINNVIKTYIDKTIKQQNLVNTEEDPQYSLLLVDVWFRGKEFLSFMRETHPTIKLVFVPAGCTSLAQPCDVFLQRPFKHSMQSKFSTWAAHECFKQLESGVTAVDVKLDLSLNTLRDNGAVWALETIKELATSDKFKETMKKGWQKTGIMNAFDVAHQLRTYKYYNELGFNWNEPFVPFRKLRFIDDIERQMTDEEVERLNHSENCCDDDEKTIEEICDDIFEELNPLGLSEEEIVLNMSMVDTDALGIVSSHRRNNQIVKSKSSSSNSERKTRSKKSNK
jgi:hypothetical protein